MEDKIKMSFVGMETSNAIKEYFMDKIVKWESILEEATSIEVFFKQNKHTRGVKEDFRVDINISLPNTLVRVEQIGEDMYANIDLSMDVLGRRLSRYSDMKEVWEGKKPWKVIEAEAELEEMEEEVDDTYAVYTPTIARRKVIKNMRPMPEAEAIERMELSGYDQYLFVHKDTGNVCMIYRRVQGGYGLVQTE